MCGVFGYITSKGQGPDIARLRRLAIITQSRGAHAFGMAWTDAAGQIHMLKRPGPARDHIDELERCRDAVALIGHCRFATHGSPLDNRNNHPHAAGSGFIAHNGVIPNHADLIRRYGLECRSECDSEVIGLLMARSSGTVGQRAAWALRRVEGTMALLGLWRDPARLLVVRRGRPLHFGEADEGYYLASLPACLPGAGTGAVQPVADRSTRVLVYGRGGLRLE